MGQYRAAPNGKAMRVVPHGKSDCCSFYEQQRVVAILFRRKRGFEMTIRRTGRTTHPCRWRARRVASIGRAAASRVSEQKPIAMRLILRRTRDRVAMMDARRAAAS